jgi:uncharacterized protein (TIGR02118 family)
MVKLVFLCRRRPDVDRVRYRDLLLRGHVPLALRHHPTMRAYVVNVVEATPPGAPELDSVGELWFDSMADFRDRLYDSPEGRRVVERDVQGFLGAADAYATTEHVQKEPAPSAAVGERSPGVKLVCPVRRRADITHAAFVEHWLRHHVPLALRHHPGLSKYVTNMVDERLSPTGEDWDGIAELHFPSAAALAEGMFDSSAGERVIREDMARFIGHTLAYRAGEYVQKRQCPESAIR